MTLHRVLASLAVAVAALTVAIAQPTGASPIETTSDPAPDCASDPRAALFMVPYAARTDPTPDGGTVTDVTQDTFTAVGLSYQTGQHLADEQTEWAAHDICLVYRLWPVRTVRLPSSLKFFGAPGTLVRAANRHEVRCTRLSTTPPPCFKEEVADATTEQMETWLAQVEQSILDVLSDPQLNSRVAAWYMGPEELDPGIPREAELLERIYKAVQELDPLNRPAWMYHPQHVGPNRLAASGPWLDALSMGAYPNNRDAPMQRIQVRHAMTQLNQAVGLLSYSLLGPQKLVLPALEMFESTEHPLNAVDAAQVVTFARHDAYAAFANGAHGVLVFSMGYRQGFESYADYYGGWAGVAHETYDLGLREVFRYGEVEFATTATVIDGPPTTDLDWPGVWQATYPSVSLRHFVHDGVDHVLMVNSAEIAVSVAVGPLASGHWYDLFGGTTHHVPASNAFVDLPPFGVALLVPGQEFGLRPGAYPR